MSVVITESVNNTDDAVTGIDAPAITPAPNERLLAFLTNDIGATTSNPTFGDDQGNSWAQLDTATETGNQRLYAYECLAPAVGVATVVNADWGTPVNALGIEVHRIFGANSVAAQHSSNVQGTPGTGTDGVTSTNLTPSSAPGLLIACTLCTHTSGGGTPNAGTGFTSIETMWTFTFDHARSEHKTYSSTSAQAATFTATGNVNHLTIAVSIAEQALPTGRYLKLVNLDEVNSSGPFSSCGEVDLYDENGDAISKTGWTASADSENASFPATLSDDGDISTLWHSEFSGTVRRHPHWLQFDLGSSLTLSYLNYTPRQSGGSNGSFRDYQLFVSDDGESWGTPVAEGRFDVQAYTDLFVPAVFDSTAPNYVGAYEANHSADSFAPIPNEAQAGDYALFFVWGFEDGTVTLGDDATGFTLLHREDHVDGPFLAIYAGTLTGSEALFSASTGNRMAVSILLVRNVHSGSPLADVGGSSGTGVVTTGPSVTASLDHSLLVFASTGTFDTFGPVTSQPTGMTWRIGEYLMTANVWTEIVGAGATGSRSVTEDGASQDWMTVMLILSPSVTSGGFDVVIGQHKFID